MKIEQLKPGWYLCTFKNIACYATTHYRAFNGVLMNIFLCQTCGMVDCTCDRDTQEFMDNRLYEMAGYESK